VRRTAACQRCAPCLCSCPATLPMVPLHGTPVLSRLARADLPLASVLPLLSQQAGWLRPLIHSRSPARAHPFPQPLWTRPWYVHWRLVRNSRPGVPKEQSSVAHTDAARLSTGARWPAAAAHTRALSNGHLTVHSQQTNLYDADAVGSCGRAGRGPTPPSSTAAPSHTPPRRGLRGFQAPTGLRTRGRTWTPVCTATRQPVRAATETAAPLECSRARLGCQAPFRPPIGSATCSVGRRALPHLIASQGAPTCSCLLASSWWSAARPRRRRGGVRSCPSVDVGRRHCACSTGTLAPGGAGVG
jgi:hypothetical protein